VTLEALNALSPEEAEAEFMRCCGSRTWAKEMTRLRPYKTSASLYATADRTWLSIAEHDWLEAFSHHPRIGDGAALEKRFASTAEWASNEQKGTAGAPRAVLDRLKQLNQEYEKKFPHVFLICATGKSAEEMLANLESRIGNDPKRELTLASGEQMKITRLRLEKLLA
jgi:2-oxo-4-hydroxy-4-carboxy-5-ureidoimidazoline decarboxylase